MAHVELIAIGAGTSLALYLMLMLLIAHQFTTPRRVIPSTPPSIPGTSPLRTVRFSARDDALRLTAWYAATPMATGAIILAHGRNACRGGELRGDTFDLVAHFVTLGFSVLLIDLRGHGSSGSARLTFGRRESRDILGAVDFLRSQGYTQLGVLGASMGGVSAIGAAANEPAIGAIVTDSAFCTLQDVLVAQFARLTRLPGWCLSGATLVASALTGERLRYHTAEHDMRQLRGRPTLVIHAEHDPFVPVAHAHALAKAGETRLWITKGTRHLSSYSEGRAEYARIVGGFFQRNLSTVQVRHPIAGHSLTADMPVSSSRALVGGLGRRMPHDTRFAAYC